MDKKKEETLLLDNTTLETYTTCPKKFQYRMIDKIRPNRESQYFAFGIAVHHGMEHYYKHKPWSYYDVALRDVDAVEDAVDSLKDVEEKDLEVLINTDDHRNYQRVIDCIQLYHDNFSGEALSVFEYNGVPVVEKSFAFPILRIETDTTIWTVVYCGRIDALINVGDKVYILDHKTASTKPKSWASKYEYPSNQFIGYLVGASVVFNVQVSGVLVNLFHILKRETNFDRAHIAYSKEQTEEWLTKVQGTATSMIHNIEDNHFEMYSTGCYGMYGKCMFQAICGAEQKLRPAIIKAEYIVDEWKPLAEEG